MLFISLLRVFTKILNQYELTLPELQRLEKQKC